jgi:hypothetical protein
MAESIQAPSSSTDAGTYETGQVGRSNDRSTEELLRERCASRDREVTGAETRCFVPAFVRFDEVDRVPSGVLKGASFVEPSWG